MQTHLYWIWIVNLDLIRLWKRPKIITNMNRIIRSVSYSTHPFDRRTEKTAHHIYGCKHKKHRLKRFQMDLYLKTRWQRQHRVLISAVMINNTRYQWRQKVFRLFIFIYQFAYELQFNLNFISLGHPTIMYVSIT